MTKVSTQKQSQASKTKERKRIFMKETYQINSPFLLIFWSPQAILFVPYSTTLISLQ